MEADKERNNAVKFLVLVFLLSVPFWLFGYFVNSEILPGLPISSVMVVCPATVGAFLVWRAGGYSALRDFFKSAVDLNMRPWVWLFALGTMPLVMLGSALVLVSLGESLPAPQIQFGQTVALLSLFLVAALAEELGWTGYLSQPLVQQHGLLVAGLVIGVVAVIWHIIPLLQADRDYSWIGWWAVGTVCRRILIVWLYVKGGQKVFAATLFHAMNNVSWMLFPVLGSHYDPASAAIILLAPVTIVGIVNRNSRDFVSLDRAHGT